MIELTPQEEQLLRSVMSEIQAEHASQEPNQEPTTEPVPVPEETANIPVNKLGLLDNPVTSRFSALPWVNMIQSRDIMLAGLGGIGSYVAYLIGRLQPRSIILYDFDAVEDVNMSGQLYDMSDIGKPKTTATRQKIAGYSNYHAVTECQRKYDGRVVHTLMTGFDNMNARNNCFCAWEAKVRSLLPEEARKYIYIDGRLNAEEFQVFCITGDDDRNIRRYKKDHLFPSSLVPPVSCTAKQTSFCANMIASVMVNLYVNFCANLLEGDEHPLIDRDLPFLTEYTASTMYFKTVR